MILVSSCLLGNNVKYNGGNNSNELLLKYSKYLTPVCPECLGKLLIPRPPAELIGGDGKAVWLGTAQVCDQHGQEVTKAFQAGAREVLKLVQENKIKVAILKANSPSCGNKKIYDGNFSGTKILGQGVTVALLEKYGVKVYSEQELDDNLLQRLIAMYK